MFAVKLVLGLKIVLFSMISSDQALVRRSKAQTSLYKIKALFEETPSPPKINNNFPL